MVYIKKKRKEWKERNCKMCKNTLCRLFFGKTILTPKLKINPYSSNLYAGWTEKEREMRETGGFRASTGNILLPLSTYINLTPPKSHFSKF